ncbi:MAG TPA: hypothetical protein ACFCUC_13065 [Desulfobacterales bacterium]
MSKHSNKKQDETEKKKKKKEEEQEDLDVCDKAPEWAEHERFRDDDMPCDDGRTGKL